MRLLSSLNRPRRVCVGVTVAEQPDALARTLSALAAPSRWRPTVLLLGDGPDRWVRAALGDLTHLRQSSTSRGRGAAACFTRLARASDADVLVLLRSGVLLGPGALDRIVDAIARDSSVGLAGPSTSDPDSAQGAFPGEGSEHVDETALAADRRFGDRIDEIHELGDFCLAVRRELIDAIGMPNSGEQMAWTREYAARARAVGMRTVWAPGAYAWQPAGPVRARPLRHGSTPGEPLVSCIMPTRERADFALQAVRMFQRQDYGNKELLIVDDGDDGLRVRLPDDARVRYMRSLRGESIGAKRNRACEAARGAFIVQWDDDDWYGPGRLSAQLAPLRDGRADISAIRMPVFFDLDHWRFWCVEPALHRSIFRSDVHGGTLAFRREIWDRCARYPNVSLAEDADFLQSAQARGARLTALDGAGLFVYVRHGSNAWRFECGSFLGAAGWQRVSEPELPEEDRGFYAARSPALARRPPLVTCLMPTRDRRPWIRQSIAYFLRQDYAARELLVLDDGADRVEDLMPDDPRVRYVAVAPGRRLGAKRNLGAELALGELIAHWDDDDWQARGRLSYQVAELEAHGADLCGPDRVLFFDPGAQRAWRYEYPSQSRPWVAGAGMCYRRERWQRMGFEAVDVGEDNRFVRSHGSRQPPLRLSKWTFFAALMHAGNTSRKEPCGAFWHPEPLSRVRSVLGADYSFYERWR